MKLQHTWADYQKAIVSNKFAHVYTIIKLQAARARHANEDRPEQQLLGLSAAPNVVKFHPCCVDFCGIIPSPWHSTPSRNHGGCRGWNHIFGKIKSGCLVWTGNGLTFLTFWVRKDYVQLQLFNVSPGWHPNMIQRWINRYQMISDCQPQRGSCWPCSQLREPCENHALPCSNWCFGTFFNVRGAPKL